MTASTSGSLKKVTIKYNYKVIENVQGQQLKIRNCSKKNFLFSVILLFSQDNLMKSRLKMKVKMIWKKVGKSVRNESWPYKDNKLSQNKCQIAQQNIYLS